MGHTQKYGKSGVNLAARDETKGTSMTREIGLRTQIALLIYTSLNVLLFTVAVYAVMMSVTLNAHAGFWLTAFVAVSLVVTAPLAWALAPRIRPDWQKKVAAVPSPLAHLPGNPV